MNEKESITDILEKIEQEEGASSSLKVYFFASKNVEDVDTQDETPCFMFSPTEAISLHDCYYVVYDEDEGVLRRYPLQVTTELDKNMTLSFCEGIHRMCVVLNKIATAKGKEFIELVSVNSLSVVLEGLRWHSLYSDTVGNIAIKGLDLLEFVFSYTHIPAEMKEFLPIDFFIETFGESDEDFWLRHIVKINPNEIVNIN